MNQGDVERAKGSWIIKQQLNEIKKAKRLRINDNCSTLLALYIVQLIRGSTVQSALS
jgi:hypothetical protein